MAVFIEGRFVTAGPRAADRLRSQVQHLKASFRTGEVREERTLFDAGGDVDTLAAARAQLTAAIGPRVAFHRVILSPGQGLVRLADVEQWTRLVLADLGRELGQQLVWVAAVHRNTGHAHVHVLLAGAAPRSRWPDRGAMRPVHLYRGHYAFLRTRAETRLRAMGDNTQQSA